MAEVNVAVVALSSLEKARKYTVEKNYGRAFAHYLVVFQLLEPEARKNYESEFVCVLHVWGNLLYNRAQYDDVFRCYNLALSYFPDNVEILNNIGVHALKLNFFSNAKRYFQNAHSRDPSFLPAEQNLQTTRAALVERWHFPMLNDTARNKAFAQAIFHQISRGFTKILDIGVGTGILSLFASKSRQTRSITACDYSETMYEIATDVLKANNVTTVKLVNKKSTKLKIPKDMPERASLLITETLDSGVFGEKILQTLIHAWDHLLLPHPYGVVIPARVELFVTGIESEAIARKSRLISTRTALRLDTFCIYHNAGYYDTENLRTTPYDPVTETLPCLHVDFNNILQLKTIIETHRHNPNVRLRALRPGRIDCFAVHFKLHLNDDVSLTNDPKQPTQTCWEQAIIHKKHPITVAPPSSIDVQLSCVNGKLAIVHDAEPPGHECHEVPKEVVQFLNDPVAFDAIVQLANVLNRPSIRVLDLSPFPLLGLLLARSGATATVTSPATSLVHDLCRANGIANVSIVDMYDLEQSGGTFDVVFQSVVASNGLLSEVEMMRARAMRSSTDERGVYVPRSVEVWAEAVQCDWLGQATKVYDKNLCGFKIAEFINEYKTTEQQDVNFDTIPHVSLSEPKKIGTVEWETADPTLTTTEIEMSRGGTANAIFYWFVIELREGLTVSTRRKDSFVNNAAFMVDEPVAVNAGDVKRLTLKQHGGILKIVIDET